MSLLRTAVPFKSIHALNSLDVYFTNYVPETHYSGSYMHQNPLEDLLKHRLQGPPSKNLLQVSGRVHVMVQLLVLGPHTED